MIDKQNMENFLQDVDDVTEQINKIMNGQYDEKEYKEIERRVNKQKYQQEEKLRKEKQRKKEEELKEKLKIQGKQGKGEGENYKNFCQFCSLEFEVDSPECFRCKRKTITQLQRKQFLLKKVEEFKVKKIKREERKKRWELWQKTKAIYSRKNITDYEKWDLFTDSENSDEEFQKKNPILPKNDPAFAAMENDLKKRNNERNQRRLVADKLKQQGNKKFQQKNYIDAIDFYTQGIEAHRQNKALWLNRALCYIKIKKFEAAIKDCSDMIEYMDILEDGFDKSKNFAVKAFLRRSMAKFEQKKYEEALKDAQKAKEIHQQSDQEIDSHIQKINQFCQFSNDLQQNCKLTEIQQELKDNILEKKIDEIDWKKFQDKILNNKIYEQYLLISEKYFLHLKQHLNKEIFDKIYEQDQILNQNVLHFFNNLVNKNELFIDVLISSGIVYSLIKILTQILKENNIEELKYIFGFDQILEILLIISLQHKGRAYLTDRYQFIINLLSIFMDKFENGNKKLTHLLQQGFKISGNLMYEESKNKQVTKFKQDFNFELKNKTFKILFILLQENKNQSMNLVSSIFSMFTNLLNNKNIRSELTKDVFYLKDKQTHFIKFFNKIDCKNYEVLENFLNFFVNLSYQNLNFKELISDDLKVFFSQKLIHCYQDNQSSLCQKILLVLSKSDLHKKELMIVNSFILKNFLKQYIKNCTHNHCVLLLNQSFEKFTTDYNQKIFADFQNIFSDLFQYINKNKDNPSQLACLNNTIVFLSNLIEKVETLNEFSDIFIQPLIYILKEKTGVLRKQAAIMIAKMSKNQKNLEQIRKLHGTEILMNLQNYLIDKQLL